MKTRIFILSSVLVCTASAYAQTGTGGGLFSDTAGRIKSAVFANLGTPVAGNARYCTNCAATSPCTGGGTGAFAYRVGAAWNCTDGSAGGGGGSFTGPVSSTLNAVLRFADTTGAVGKNSVVTIDDSGNIVGALSLRIAGANSQLLSTDATGLRIRDLGGSDKATVDDRSLLTADRIVTWPDAAGTVTLGGNTFTGTGPIARGTSPSFVAPALGTPTAAVLTNATGTAAGLIVGAASASDHSIAPCGANTWANGLSTAWVLNCVQPAFSNISGSFTLAQFPTIATNTVLGNGTSGTTVPTALTIGSCSTSGSAVLWTTNTGWGCNTGIAALTATTLATPRAINGVNFDGSVPITVTAAGSTLSDTVTVAKGGTGQTTYTKGDMLAAPGGASLNKVAVGTDGQVWTADAASTNGVKWAAAAAGAACAACTPNVIQKGNGANTLQDSGISESAGTMSTGAGVALGLTATAPTAAASTTAGVGANLTASSAVAGTTNAGAAAGGAVTITSGAAAQKTSGNANGGDINLTTGAGVGTGAAGRVVLGTSGSYLLLPNGTATLPAIQFSSSFQNFGIRYSSGNNSFVMSHNNTNDISFNAASIGIRLTSNSMYGWNSGSDADSASDTATSRLAPGVVADGTGAQGSTAGWRDYNGTGRVASDLTNATATMSNVTLSQNPTLIAGRKYVGRFSIKGNNSTATEGIQFDFGGGSATFTSFAAGGGVLASGGTDVIGTNITTSATTAITFTTLTGESWIVIEVSFVCNAAGTIIPRFAENSSTVGTATLRANSFFWLQDTP